MAIRLDKVVVRGEISNEVRGIVTGRIWLMDRPEPLEIALEGNCLRDLAGCILRFKNPRPQSDPTARQLVELQEGRTGDMTASRKSKIPTVDDDELMRLLHSQEEIPYMLANVLYLEWFSKDNGRVVLESADFALEISEPAWTMSHEEEVVQISESQENFYQFLDQLTGVTTQTDDEEDLLEEEVETEEADDDEVDNEWGAIEEEDEPLNEFEWEQELREADKRAEAYQEAFDRYKEHPDRERLIAEAMGWDAEEIEEFRDEWEDVAEGFQETDPQVLIEQADHLVEEDNEEMHHPLSRRAMRFALRLQEDAEKLGLLKMEKVSKDSPLLSVIVSIIALGGKLAAALDGIVMGYDPEPGFIIAMLKRSQIPLNEALHSLASVDPRNLPVDARMWLATARSELFDLRKDILDVMKEMRQQ